MSISMIWGIMHMVYVQLNVLNDLIILKLCEYINFLTFWQTRRWEGKTPLVYAWKNE